MDDGDEGEGQGGGMREERSEKGVFGDVGEG